MLVFTEVGKMSGREICGGLGPKYRQAIHDMDATLCQLPFQAI
jgi:hypothetical protein